MKIPYIPNPVVFMCIGFLSTACGFYTIDNQTGQAVTIVINGEENKEIPPCECIRLTEKFFGLSGNFPFRRPGNTETEYGSGNYKITSNLTQNSCNNEGSDTGGHQNQQNRGMPKPSPETLSVTKVDNKCEDSKEVDSTDSTETESSVNVTNMKLEDRHEVLCPETSRPGCPEEYETMACFSPKDEDWGKPILPFCVNNTEGENNAGKKIKPRCLGGNNLFPVCVEKDKEKMYPSPENDRIVCRLSGVARTEDYQAKCLASGAVPVCALFQESQQGKGIVPACLSQDGKVLEMAQCADNENNRAGNVSAVCEQDP